MKYLKKITVVAMLFVAATSFVNAQSKTAHINVQQLLSEMAEMKAAQEELKKLQSTYQADIEGSLKDLQNKYTQYANEAATKSDEENKKRAEELQVFKKNIDDAQLAAQQELQKKQQELFAPITEKAKVAIDKVAAGLGYDYVLDSGPGLGVVIVANGKDIMAEVKKELGF